jgi:hypothetical protein
LRYPKSTPYIPVLIEALELLMYKLWFETGFKAALLNGTASLLNMLQTSTGVITPYEISLLSITGLTPDESVRNVENPVIGSSFSVDFVPHDHNNIKRIGRRKRRFFIDH